MNEVGPFGFPAGLLKNGDKVEFIPGENMEVEVGDIALYRAMFLRGNKSVVQARKRLEKCLKKTEKNNSYKHGLIVGKCSALDWMLGEPWDCSRVNVVAERSTRDHDGINDLFEEFWDKVWYVRNQQCLANGGTKGTGFGSQCPPPL